MKETIIFVGIILAMFLTFYWIGSIVQEEICPQGTYGKKAGCGISQSEIDKNWCENQGGHYFEGGFSSGNCVIPK